eukprot:1161010-Pelagomonas_calceolata.AAC.2
MASWLSCIRKSLQREASLDLAHNNALRIFLLGVDLFTEGPIAALLPTHRRKLFKSSEMEHVAAIGGVPPVADFG